MEKWLIDNLFAIISTLFGSGSLFAYLSERKKRKIQENKETSDALMSMQNAYDKFTEDFLEKYNDLKENVKDLQDKLLEVTEQLNLEKDKYEKLKASYDKLKQEFEAYKRKHRK